MSTRDRLSVASGIAVLLASSALWQIFSQQAWLMPALGAVLVVVATSMLIRRTRMPVVLQPAATLLALLAYVLLVFAGSTLHHLVLPGRDTVLALQALLQQAGTDIQEYGPPVPAHRGLVLLVVLGVGAVALAVEVVAGLAGRAALAGLPLLALFAVPSGVLSEGLGWLPFTLGAAGWLGLLLVEGLDDVTRWGTPLRASGTGEPVGLGRIGRRIGGAALGVALVVPALLPGLDARLFDEGRGGGTGGSGGSHSVRTYNPITRLRGQLTLPEPVDVLRYTTNDPEPDYLRLTTLGLYDGEGWRQTEQRGNLRDDGVDRPLPRPSGLRSDLPTRPVEARIEVLSLDAFWLPAPATPAQVAVEGPWMWDRGSETVFATRAGTEDVPPYTVQSSRSLPDAGLLSKSGGYLPEEVQPYDQPIQVTPKVKALTERIVRGQNSSYGRAAALQSFFRNADESFRYSEQTREGTSPDALESFLEKREGFCEQYASAMAAMLRLSGVPSRVAVGFTAGTKTADGSYLVTTNEAHAWPEAWFDGAGWVRFEPTPSQAGVRPPVYASPSAAASLPEGDAAADPAGAEGAGRESLNAIERQQKLESAGMQADQAEPADSGGGLAAAPRRLLLGGAAALLLLAAPAVLDVLRRRRRWTQPGADTAWTQVREDAVDVGHPWREADSPRQAAARLVRERRLPTPEAEALDRLVQVVERARYARPGAGGDGRGLAADCSRVRRGLLEAAPRGRRLRAQLMPPSTVRWAAAAGAAGGADLLNAVDRTGARIARRLRRRAA